MGRDKKKEKKFPERKEKNILVYKRITLNVSIGIREEWVLFNFYHFIVTRKNFACKSPHSYNHSPWDANLGCMVSWGTTLDINKALFQKNQSK